MYILLSALNITITIPPYTVLKIKFGSWSVNIFSNINVHLPKIIFILGHILKWVGK